MPTGYTHPVQTGEVKDFATFAMQCARAFSALVMMRDDPADTPIPDEFQPSEYHRQALEKAAAELQRLQGMTWEEIVAAAHEDRNAEIQRWEEHVQRQKTERCRYEAMLSQVKAWTPPSPDHQELKNFMVQQLEESIRLDCGYKVPRPSIKTADEWHRDKIEKAHRDVERHTAEDRKERERTEGRNRWVRELRASLATPAPQGATGE